MILKKSFLQIFAPKKTEMGLMDSWVSKYGAPLKLLSDRGPALVGEVMANVCILMGTKKEFTSLWHPQKDGLIEGFHRTLAHLASFDFVLSR